jgi:hypothetical protein
MEPVGLVALVGVRTPKGFLLYERRIPPCFTRPFNVWPYNSLSALVAEATSSNSTKHMGPLLF